MLQKNKHLLLTIFFGIILFIPLSYAEDKQAKIVREEPKPKEASVVGGFVYDSKGKRDPFIPIVTDDGRILDLDTVSNKEGTVRIEGIIYDPQGVSYTIINSMILKVGDWVAMYQVVDIQPKKVILTNGSQKLEVEVKKEE